jgi:hypothetical protein
MYRQNSRMLINGMVQPPWVLKANKNTKCVRLKSEEKNSKTCFEGSNTTTINCGPYHFWGSKRLYKSPH